ncbi:MAG: choline dehydrogenase, partial [Rhodospirillaceae bacterium]|nr:choline dehydrogenase [Rhodospirillaceae bacterium]
MDGTYDYIIVGAGSAGCVLASRLSEDPHTQVLLLEAGGRDSSLYIQMPSALSIPMNMDRYNWRYETEPEPGLGGRRLHCPRGKVLGGSSAINGMVYVRGNALDYDTWAEMGAEGWSYREVLPYFRRAETYAEGGDEYRGDSGPLHTRAGSMTNPLYRAFVEAGVQAGYPFTPDMNGFQQEGFGRMDMTVHAGRRWSAAAAYIHPVRSRKNLRIELGVQVAGIAIEGNRAGGVAYMRPDGTRAVARAEREVILSAGPINSPHLLMLSGIGPAAHLAEHGIQVRVDLPGVGQNLMDHLEFYFQQECTQPITLYRAMSPLAKAMIGARWWLAKDGLGATNHFEAGGFIRSRPGVRWPDIQYHFLPLAIAYDGSSLADRHGFQVHVGSMRSKSRGWVKLRSADPRDKARVFFNYMSHEEDWIEFRACVRLTREIFAQPAFDPYRGAEIQPGPQVQTDAEIDEFVRQKVESAYHPCGTCRMGTDRDAVVDSRCKVHGIEGLRVVDSSIMPQITTGNLNAPTIMLAEKAADMIRGRP